MAAAGGSAAAAAAAAPVAALDTFEEALAKATVYCVVRTLIRKE